jgi:hypothetical protein
VGLCEPRASTDGCRYPTIAAFEPDEPSTDVGEFLRALMAVRRRGDTEMPRHLGDSESPSFPVSP